MFVSEIIDEASEILATTDQAKVFKKLTQAVQTLMESGHYFHINSEVDVCTGWDGQTITLPRGIEVPLAVNVDGSPQYFRGRLFQYHVNKGGMYNPVDWAWDDRGFVSTIMDIRQPSQLVAVAEHAADANQQIRVIGTDSNNRELRTQYPDGTLVDGLFIPIHAISDFPVGSIEPDGVTIQTLTSNVSPISTFLSSAAHQLVSGQPMTLSLGTGLIPSFLYAGQTYYIGVDDNFTIQLYQTQLDAIAGTNPINLQSVSSTTSINLTDSIPCSLLTSVNLQSVPPITIDSPNEVTFSTSTTTGFSGSLPSPLAANTTYFANSLDSQNLQVFTNIVDAKNSTNPIALTGNSGLFNTDIRKAVAPETILSFALPHYFQNGDQVEAYTSGGTLPTPLITGVNYFVNVIDSSTISLHTSQADALSSSTTLLVNPVVLTDNGTGTNSIVKLLPATSTTGTQSQITAPGLQIAAPTGAGAQAQAVIVGSVVSTTISNGGSKYTSTPSVTFTPPPSPPVGSNQSTSTATGYAVMVPDSIGSTTYAVGSIVITNAGLGYTTAPVISISAPPSGGTQAVANSTIQTSFVSSFTLISGGFGYTEPPQVSITGGGGSGATASATINSTTNTLTSLTSSGTTASAVVSIGHGYINGQKVQISGATPNGYNGIFAISVPSVNQNISSGNLTGSGVTASCTLTGHGYASGQSVTIAGANQSYYNGNFVINVIDENTFTYNTIATIAVSPATGTITASIPNSTNFSYTLASSLSSPATGTITSYSGNVTAINVITEGTQYTSQPTIKITPSTGVFVQFTSTGTLPAPLVAGTAYRAEAPLNGVTGTFSVVNSDFSPITITSSATGNFYVELSRPFSISFNNQWTGNFSGMSTGQPVYLASDYLLPTGVNNSTQYYVRLINSSTFQLYDTLSHANASPSQTGLVTITSIGVGQGYFAVRTASYAKAYNDQLAPSSVQYLTQGEIVQFSSTGSLPYPLTALTNYTIKLSGNNITLTNQQGAQIQFVNNGKPTLAIGNVSLNIVRTFTPVLSSNIEAINGLYDLGSQIQVRPNIGDALPNGLVASTPSAPQYYYVRPIGNNLFEIYDTYSHAITISSTIGRINFSNIGNTSTSTFFVDSILSATLVKSIIHVEKPQTIGYVSLYAFDYGRSNDMALIGQYHPSETNPKYRRIRIGRPCAWARILYRVKYPVISSVYDYIPLENTRAILAAVHACDLEDKDFIDQAQRYWATAIAYLRSQNESMDGHAFMPPQINNITYADGQDPSLESYYGGVW